MKKVGLVVVLVLFLSLLLSNVFVVSREVWFDEAFSLQTAYLLNEGSDIDFSAFDVHPPVYYEMLAGWMRMQPAGVEEHEWGRLLSVVFALVFVLCVFLGLYEMFGGIVAYIASLLLVFSSTYVHFGTEVRSYMFVMMCSAIAFWLLMKVIRGSEKWKVLVWIAAGVLAIAVFAHYYAAMAFVLFVGMVFVCVDEREKRKYGVWVLACVGGVVSLVAFVWFALPQMVRAEAMWFQQSTLESYPWSLSYTVFVPQTSLFGDGMVWLSWLFIAVIIAVFVWCLRLGKRSDVKDRVVWVMFLSSVFPFLGLVSSPVLSAVIGDGFGNLYHHRLFLVVTWMFAAGLFVQFVRWVVRRTRVVALVSFVIVIVVMGVLMEEYVDTSHYELERTLGAVACDGSVVVHESPFSGMPALVFDRERGCDMNRHVVVTGISREQSFTAGFDAWDPNDVYWDERVPGVSEFVYVHAAGIGSVDGLEYEVVYQDDGIDVRVVRNRGE